MLQPTRRSISWACACLLLPAGAGFAQRLPVEIEENLTQLSTVLPPQPFAVGSVRVSAGGSPVQGVEEGAIYAPDLSDRCWPTAIPERGAVAAKLSQAVILEVSVVGCDVPPPDPSKPPPPGPPLQGGPPQQGGPLRGRPQLPGEPQLPGSQLPDSQLPRPGIPRPPRPDRPMPRPPTQKPPGAAPDVECAWMLDPFTADDPSCQRVAGSKQSGIVSWTGWKGEIPLPAMAETGSYRLRLQCAANGLPPIGPPLWTDVYVTYGEPLAVFSPPETDWYSKAACWAGGLTTANSEQDVIEAVLAGIYQFGEHHWLYGYADQVDGDGRYSFAVSTSEAGSQTIEYTINDPALKPKCTSRCKCYWQGLVAESSPCNFGDCYVFSDVLQAISGVMGVGGLRYVAITGAAGLGFLTRPSAALDPKFTASVGCLDNDETCYPYLFSSHSLRGRDELFYDATFNAITRRADESVALSKTDSTDRLVTFLNSDRVLYSRGTQYGSWSFYESLPDALHLSMAQAPQYLRFTGDVTLDTKDEDGDGVFEYLVAKVGVEVLFPGTYVVHGALAKDDKIIAHQASYWSSQPTAALVSGRPGIYTATLYLSGQEIFQSGQDGPYEFFALTHGDDYELTRASTRTAALRYRDFGELDAAINAGTTVQPVDADGDGSFDRLAITVPVTVRSDTEWAVGARLAKEGSTIGYAGVRRKTPAGDYTIDLAISGERIASRGLDGPWDLTLVLYNGRLQALVDVQLTVDGHRAARFR